MHGLDIQNENKMYLDEKELYILYQLRKNKRISTQSCEAFEPKNKYTFHIPDHNDANALKEELEKFRSRALDGIRRKAQSPAVLSYLLDLGKTLDPKGFSVEVGAYYSLEEGGFLCEWDGHKHFPTQAYQDAILNKEAEPDFIELTNKLITKGDSGKWELLKTFMTENIKSTPINCNSWKLNFPNTAKLTTITKQPLPQCFP